MSEFKEYHTSLDNFDLVTKKLREGYNVVKKALEIIHKKKIFLKAKYYVNHF